MVMSLDSGKQLPGCGVMRQELLTLHVSTATVISPQTPSIQICVFQIFLLDKNVLCVTVMG
jgi:hypothetical protein